MSASSPAWERRYARKLLVTDVIVVIAAVATAQILRFGLTMAELEIPISRHKEFAITYFALSILVVLGWMAALSIGGTRDAKVFGVGPAEYRRVITATFVFFGSFAIVAFLAQVEIGRGYLFIALPLGLTLLLLSRWAWRRRLHRQRRRGKNTYRTLVVGERLKAAHVITGMARDTYAGFDVIGVVTERGTQTEVLPGVGVLGSYNDLLEVVGEHDVDVMVMVSSDRIAPERLRQIGWELEHRRIDLVVAASLTDVAGPRIHARPVAGMPLIHVDYPRFVGRRRFVKRVFDLFSSGMGLILLSPVFLVIALAVKIDSRGPALFRQERIGMNGTPFRMLKFRSMVVDAEEQLPGLLDQSDGDGLLFKMRNDPRVTRVGRFIRKFSLDELPQLVNVFKGEMSLVGPRPPLPVEVDAYDEWTHRRLLMKPGITGLWQVSGRSDLSWDDSVRLDLYYVENWSLVGDILIVLRTIRIMLFPKGAY